MQILKWIQMDRCRDVYDQMAKQETQNFTVSVKAHIYVCRDVHDKDRRRDVKKRPDTRLP